tara:strand:- start:440 stop:1282 length:843 start_codon:yes stop_codon:yes gene_type:complete
MSEIDDIQKQLEGNSLALGAVAEVLQKMDARLSKQEEEEDAKAEEENAEMAKAALTKSVAAEVVKLLKEDPDNKLGLDTDGEKDRPAKATAPAAADTEKPVSPTTKIEDQQNAIQASTEASLSKDGDEEEEESEDMDNMETKAATDDDEKPEDMDKGDGDDEDKDDSDGESMESMKKQIEDLKKQIASFDMEKAVQTETEARLRKMGFREENGLQRPQVFTPDNPNANPLGTDGSTPIVKGASAGDTVDQLSGLSYKQLRDLQHKIDSGDTDGVPRELLG